MIVVLGGINRLECGGRNRGGKVFGKCGKPFHRIADRVRIKDASEIEPKLHFIKKEWRFRFPKEFDGALDPVVFLADSGFDSDLSQGFRNGEEEPVLPLLVC